MPYNDLNAYKDIARKKLNRAVFAGRIIKPDICEICGELSLIIHGHHEDYDKPLDVLWVCPGCHTDIHRSKKAVRGEEIYKKAVKIAKKMVENIKVPYSSVNSKITDEKDKFDLHTSFSGGVVITPYKNFSGGIYGVGKGYRHD